MLALVEASAAPPTANNPATALARFGAAALRDDDLVGSLTLVWEDPLIWGSRN